MERKIQRLLVERSHLRRASANGVLSAAAEAFGRPASRPADSASAVGSAAPRT